MKSMTNTNRAWLAGLFEGEGCAGLYHSSKGQTITARICMTDPEPVYKVQSMCGGGVSVRNPKNPKWSTSYTWSLNSYKQVIQFIELIRPWLSERRIAQADAAIGGFVPKDRRTREN